MTAFSSIWVMVTQAKAFCGISEAALIEGGLQILYLTFSLEVFIV